MNWKMIGLMALALMIVLSCDALPLTPPPLPTAGETAATGPTSETPLAGETAAAGPTSETTLTGTPFAYENISLLIPAGLATGATPEAMPAVGAEAAPWEIAPAHTRITLTGYPLQGTLFEPHILVYPAAEYEASDHPSAAQVLDRLRVLLSEADVPLNDEVPGVPMFNAAKPFGAQIARIDMQNGSGVRLLTEYAQGVTPISNQELIYQFQGLTSDGKYYVIANLPVNASFLAADEDPGSSLPAEGIPLPDLNSADAAQINAYVQAVAEKLNATPPASFQPPLAQLDALVQSIQIAP